jgi:hypothetical protein
MKLWRLALAYPKIAAALLLTVLALGWHFQDKISDWWDGRKIERLESQVAALTATVEAQGRQIAQQEAATKAAQAARERNDAVIPKTRRDTAGRVERAPVADAATELQDDTATVDGYNAARDRLRGTGTR